MTEESLPEDVRKKLNELAENPDVGRFAGSRSADARSAAWRSAHPSLGAVPLAGSSTTECPSGGPMYQCANDGWQYVCTQSQTCASTSQFSPACGVNGYECEQFTCGSDFLCNATFDYICDTSFKCSDKFTCKTGHIFDCALNHTCSQNFQAINPPGTKCTSVHDYSVPLPGGSTDTTPGDTVCGFRSGGTTYA